MEQLLTLCKKTFVHVVVCSSVFFLVFGLVASPVFAQYPGDYNIQTGVDNSSTGGGNLNGYDTTTGVSGQTTGEFGSNLNNNTYNTGLQTTSQSGYQYEAGQGTVENPNNPGQAAAATGGNQVTGGSQTTNLTESASGIASCVLGGVVSSLISNFISTIVNTDKYVKLNTTDVSDDRKSGDSWGIIPSADSIAYCVINGMIDYIANATIEWINSGFDGNPAFVSDPKQFFQDIATQETSGFLQEVVYNSTGLNICQPFRVEIATSLGAGTGMPNYGQRAQCTLEQAAQNAQNFDISVTDGRTPTGGGFSGFWNMTQNNQNNRYGAYLMAQNEMQKRVSLQQNTLQVDLNQGNGFLSFKRCNPDSTTTNDKGETVQVKGACGITTPGHVIEDQLNSKLKMGDNRLVMADKFDQVVSALVNALIKTALNQVLNNTGTQ